MQYIITALGDAVIPRPVPLDTPYWILDEVKDSVSGKTRYTLLVEASSLDQVTYYWPRTETITELEGDYEGRLPTKTNPTGNEKGLIRLSFKYPKGLPTPSNPYPHIKVWASLGGDGCEYDRWTIVVDSFEDLKERWPGAWDVSVVSEGLPYET